MIVLPSTKVSLPVAFHAVESRLVGPAVVNRLRDVISSDLPRYLLLIFCGGSTE